MGLYTIKVWAYILWGGGVDLCAMGVLYGFIYYGCMGSYSMMVWVYILWGYEFIYYGGMSSYTMGVGVYIL